MNLVNHARAELQTAGWLHPDSAYDGMLGKAALALIKLFAKQGHSGMSAELTTQLFEKLARFQPLTPLTGEDDEWNEPIPGIYQNRRCSHVFKENGSAYDQEGKVFRVPGGATYVGRGSRVPVTFPYTPKTVFVEIPEETQETIKGG